MKNEKDLTDTEKKHIKVLRALSQRHRNAVLFVARSFQQAEARTAGKTSKR